MRWRAKRRISWPGHEVGRWTRIMVFISTTRAAILTRRRRNVSNCATRQGVAVLDQPIDLPQRVVAAASRTEAIAHVVEPRLENRFDHEPDGLLDDAVLDRRNT